MTSAITLYMTKTGDKLQWMPHNKIMYNAFVSTVKEDQTVAIKLQVNRPRKTLPQLGYYHSVMLPFAVEGFRELGHDVIGVLSFYGDAVETKTTVKSMDIYFKGLFQVYKGLDRELRKRDMTVDDCSEFIGFLLKWMVEKPGLYCPPPKPKEK